MRLAIVAVSLLAATGVGGLVLKPTLVDVQDAPRRLDAADLDGDGDVDLFVVADGAGEAASLQVLLNDGGDFTPGWTAAESSSSGTLPFDVDLADTDNDGDPDVLYVLPFGGSPKQRFNDGTGQFSSAAYLPVYAPRAEQEPADFDADGDVDIAYFEEDITGYFGTMQGDGSGSFEFDFSTETWFGLFGTFDLGRRIELGDLTGDGIPDAAMASTNGLGFFESGPIGSSASGLPKWQNQVELYLQPCADVALADLDGNARLDIMATVPSLHSIVVFVHATSGFSLPRFYPAGAGPLAMATTDLDLDGHVDVVVTNSNNRLNVLLGTGTGGFLPPKGFRVGKQPVDVVAADFDDDGDDDLAVACSQAGHVTVLLNNTAPRQPEIVGWR